MPNRSGVSEQRTSGGFVENLVKVGCLTSAAVIVWTIAHRVIELKNQGVGDLRELWVPIFFGAGLTVLATQALKLRNQIGWNRRDQG